MKQEFPEIFEEPYEKIVKLDEDWMKSKEGKERWRKFIESCATSFPLAGYPVIPRPCLYATCSYKDSVKDYNFGSLIRTDAQDEYSETNTIFSESPCGATLTVFTDRSFHGTATRIQVSSPFVRLPSWQLNFIRLIVLRVRNRPQQARPQ